MANILVGDVWLLGGQRNMEFEIYTAEWLDRNAGQGGGPNWGRSIVLSSPCVPEPLYFRYAWFL